MGSFTEGETIPSCHRFSEIQSDFCLRNDAAVPLLKCPQHPPSKWNSEFSVTLQTRYLKSSASEVHYVMLQPLKTGALTAFGPLSHAKCVWRWQMWWSHYMPEVKWSEVAQSGPTLCDPMDCSPPGSLVRGIFQAWILECVAVSFSRGSSRPRDWTQVSRFVGRRFTIWATREAPHYMPSGNQTSRVCLGLLTWGDL